MLGSVGRVCNSRSRDCEFKFHVRGGAYFKKHLKKYAGTVGTCQDCLENKQSTGHPTYIEICKQLGLFSTRKGS